ncbi:hypothetical protein Zmor_021765 [Zophobas morio]|uniref:Uncharacterized protein n=1 Tax=Zophobas morio TaxID=2755281 RepID=A0AA38I6T5_9CUCU|nr:hypothetical protein Zmor_021765 [Zophobas morio]
MTFDGEIYGHKVPIKIHIVKQDCNIPFDGLIGNDFLQPQNAQIDYKNCTLKIDSLPFNIPIYLNCNPNKNESYILKARTEAVIEVNIINDNLNEGIIKETPIIDGVYLAKSIVKVNNQKAITTIINTLERDVRINHINVELEEFDENKSNIPISSK